jgi:RND family efflux transporter MFP subunit
VLRAGTVTVVRLLAVALLVSACSHPDQEAQRVVVEAAVAPAQRTAIPAYQSVSGTVRARTTSALAANVVGTVVSVRVSEGDRVRAGDVLVEIDARESRAGAARARSGGEEVERAIEAATANARLAEATDRRIAALRDAGIASQQQRDESEAAARAARAEVTRLIAQRGQARAATEQADAVLAYSSVRAPIDGVITGRMIDPGAQAAPGVPLLMIEDERATRVDSTVPEGLAVRAGDRARVEFEGDVLTARVSHVQPSVDRGSRSSIVKLELERPLRAGSYVKVSLSSGSRASIVVPVGSIVRRGPLTSVFVLDADRVARMRLITLGAVEGQQAEVLSGLSAGELIVAAPASVREGVTVRSRA